MQKLCFFENLERAFIVLVDEKITLVEKKSEYQSPKKKELTSQTEEKSSYVESISMISLTNIC